MAAFTAISAAPSGERRSDVSDVRQQLKDPLLDSDPARKRTVLQRVIALMTMGVDTSSLLPDVILACFTPDLVSKKLIYFFLTTHSERNAELAILSINTFLKECEDHNPLVRGLALRTLASLKGLPQLFDYLLPALKRMLGDSASYVRKIAVLCTLTVFATSPSEFIANGLYDSVLSMLRDTDPRVCANALEVLLEIDDFDRHWEESRERRLNGERSTREGSVGSGSTRQPRRAAGGYEPSQHTPFPMTKSVLYHLLNHLDGLNAWQQTQVIDLIQQYTPSSEDEMFDVMNVLEERLTGMHSGLSLSCCHAFVHLTQNYPAVHAQVLERVRQPLLMLLACSPSIECSYAVLCHVKLFAKRAPATYRHAYRSCFCRFTDPSYVKAIKMDILSIIADTDSAAAVIEELLAVTEDRNLIVARRAVEALGTIALRLPEALKPILAKFTECVALDTGRVRGTILVVMRDLLRRYSDLETVWPFLDALVQAHSTSTFTDDESRVGLLWVLGDFGEHIADAPYILDSLSDSLLSESPAFRLQMLTSAVTLFFKRPPEMQALLGKIFSVLVNDFSSADVLDRAMMYYRLLRDDPVATAHVVCAPKRAVMAFTEDQDADVVDKLFFEQFNSLSVVYGLTADRYSAAWALHTADEEDEEQEEQGEMLLDTTGAPSVNEKGQALLGNRQGTEDTAIGGERLLSDAATEQAAAAAAVVGATSQSSVETATLALSPDVDVAPEEFQRLWSSTLTVAACPVSLRRPLNSNALEAYLENHSVFTLASGVQGGVYKLYLYAAAASCNSVGDVDALFGAAPVNPVTAPASSPFLMEIVAPSTSNSALLTVKSADATRGAHFSALLQRLLHGFGK